MAKDTKMMYIENDIDKIKLKTNGYIQEYGRAGTFHLVREVVQNSIDECLDSDSPGKNIHLTYDLDTGIFTSEDDGRGFPEKDYPMNIFVEKIQSGSKFYRESGTASAGEFGVGLTVCNALSDHFKITSYREVEGTEHTLEYSEGILKKDKITKNKGRHGCVVEIRVSKKYMGNDCDVPTEDVAHWMDRLFYLDSERLQKKGIKCTFEVVKGLKIKESYKFKPKPFRELLDKVLPAGVKKKDMTPICSFSGETSFIEESKVLKEINGKTEIEKVPIERLIHMDVAFQYCTSPDMSEPATYDTYCNYANTIGNGTHLDAFDEVYCRYIQNAINSSMSDKQKSKLQIKWDDIRTNLFCVINLSTSAAVGFVGNAKEKISADQLLPYMKELISTELEKYFKGNSDQLNTIIKITKINAKARIEATKAKVATQTERLNTLSEHNMKGYIRCNNTGKQWKELCIFEGDSAAGSGRNGRNADTTALFLMRGVGANAFKHKSVSSIMENAEYRNLVTAMRCGIGPKFDISKLYFNRINIMTDSDIDGLTLSSCKTTLTAGKPHVGNQQPRLIM